MQHGLAREMQYVGTETAPPGISRDYKETLFNQCQCPGPRGLRGTYMALYQLTCHFRLGGEALCS